MSGKERYRTGEESLEERLRKHLTEATEWYKKGGGDDTEEERDKLRENRENDRAWKGWRIGRQMGRKMTNGEERKKVVEEGLIRGVLFLPYTENSELAKRVRIKLKQLEDLSSLRVRIVERTGEKLVDCIHKSNPWKATDCKRENCRFCEDEKMVGKCKDKGVVYEIECITCKKENNKVKDKEKEKRENERIEEEEMNTGEKRKWRRDDDDEGSKEEKPETKPAVKYIGETSRSAFERYKEHLEDFRNIRVKSHILKLYLESHRDIDLEDLEVKMKILKKYRTSFERQIGESIWINHNLKLGTHLLNSKNEYNRCSIPRLGLIVTKEDMVDEYRENQRENEMKREISKLKEEIRRETKNEMNKSKRRKLSEAFREKLR